MGVTLFEHFVSDSIIQIYYRLVSFIVIKISSNDSLIISNHSKFCNEFFFFNKFSRDNYNIECFCNLFKKYVSMIDSNPLRNSPDGIYPLLAIGNDS